MHHAAWAADVLARRSGELARKTEGGAAGPLGPVVRAEVARTFAAVLESTGVFKRDETGAAGWDAFIASLG